MAEKVREIALDTETTGLSFESGDRLVEIGCVEMFNGVATGSTLHFYLNPEREVPYEAEQVHGLSTKFLSDKPIFSDISDSFLDWIGDAKLVIHNAAFDMAFINGELSLLGLGPLKNEIIDTLSMARKKFPGSRNSLDALCKRFKIDARTRVKHGALVDAELLAKVYLELTGGAILSFDLDAPPANSDSFKVRENDNKDEFVSVGNVLTKPANNRLIKPSETELCKHKEFVAANKISSWNL